MSQPQNKAIIYLPYSDLIALSGSIGEKEFNAVLNSAPTSSGFPLTEHTLIELHRASNNALASILTKKFGADAKVMFEEIIDHLPKSNDRAYFRGVVSSFREVHSNFTNEERGD